MEMKLDPEYYEAIFTGVKTGELRVFDEKRQSLKLRDNITFTSRENGEQFARRVNGLMWFPTFREAIEYWGVRKLLPNCHTEKDGIRTYEEFSNYKEDAEKYGVVLIIF